MYLTFKSLNVIKCNDCDPTADASLDPSLCETRTEKNYIDNFAKLIMDKTRVFFFISLLFYSSHLGVNLANLIY